MVKLMTIFAHQDDETFSAGGILSRYAEIGESYAVTVTSDEQRDDEFTKACKILGCKGIILQNKEVSSNNEKEIKEQVLAVLREIKPDIVITHVDFDYHHEHRRVRNIVEEAVEWVSHTTSKEESHQVKMMWAAETTVLIPVPQIFIDVTDYNEKRMEAIEVYESQSHKGGEGFYSNFHFNRTKLRGIQSGCGHAEAFLQVTINISGSFKPVKNYKNFPI